MGLGRAARGAGRGSSPCSSALMISRCSAEYFGLHVVRVERSRGGRVRSEHTDLARVDDQLLGTPCTGRCPGQCRRSRRRARAGRDRRTARRRSCGARRSRSCRPGPGSGCRVVAGSLAQVVAVDALDDDRVEADLGDADARPPRLRRAGGGAGSVVVVVVVVGAVVTVVGAGRAVACCPRPFAARR